jgi:hypothetical protein
VAEREKLREERQESDAEETLVSEWFDQVQAGAESDGADVAGCRSDAVAEWLQDDPEFIAGLNRAKSFRRDRLRADVLSLASDAMATLRELVSGPNVPPIGPSLSLPESRKAVRRFGANATTAVRPARAGPRRPCGRSRQNRVSLLSEFKSVFTAFFEACLCGGSFCGISCSDPRAACKRRPESGATNSCHAIT